MSDDNQGRGDLTRAINALILQRAQTSDAAQIASLNDAIDNLQGNLQDLNQAQGEAATQIMNQASEQLQQVLAQAPKDLLDQAGQQIRQAIKNLRS
ncbi:MAG: hypothetical protein RL748_4538 [Pseudomonadota bacterium]